MTNRCDICDFYSPNPGIFREDPITGRDVCHVCRQAIFEASYDPLEYGLIDPDLDQGPFDEAFETSLTRELVNDQRLIKDTLLEVDYERDS